MPSSEPCASHSTPWRKNPPTRHPFTPVSPSLQSRSPGRDTSPSTTPSETHFNKQLFFITNATTFPSSDNDTASTFPSTVSADAMLDAELTLSRLGESPSKATPSATGTTCVRPCTSASTTLTASPTPAATAIAFGGAMERAPWKEVRSTTRRREAEAEAEKRETTPAAQEARRQGGEWDEGRGQREVMAAACAQRREEGRGDGEERSGQWRMVPSAAPVKSAAGVAAAAVMWWDGGDGDQSAATEWHFMGGGDGRSGRRREVGVGLDSPVRVARSSLS
uniref:Uncharacterized protein n=1 Tax=Oryza brachyantha TaxID=4533 RepID=J3MEH3_ORYBR